MKILFIHQNHPAQFGQFAEYLAQLGWDVSFATAREKVQKQSNSKVKIYKFGANREPSKDTHHYLRVSEKAVLNAQGFARLAVKLQGEGYRPDLVVAHSGWGSGSLAKTIWPEAKFIQYLEWWYNYPHWDQLDGPSDENPIDKKAATQFRNLPFMFDWAEADATMVPTRFQASSIPKKFRKNIVLSHDGVDTSFFAPQDTREKFCDAHGIPKTKELITYATRGMEPHRGFPQFMEALAELQKSRPDLHCVIAGNDSVHYGSKPADGKTYKELALENLELDETRIHFVGLLPFGQYRDLLCASDCHVYLTLPFVLSWSLLEAMACAAPIVSNANAATEEMLEDGKTALLGQLEDPKTISTAISRMLDDRELAKDLGAAAKSMIDATYAQEKLFPNKAAFLKGLVTQNES